MPAGISSSQVRNAAVLKEFLRKLPLIPRIFSSAMVAPFLEGGELTAAISGGDGDAGPDSGDAGDAAGHVRARAYAAARPMHRRARAGGDRRAHVRANA